MIVGFVCFFKYQEWGTSCPHEYLGCYRLEHDMSWTPSEQMEQRGQELAVVDKILNTQLALQDSSSILRGEKCWTAKDQGAKVEEVKVSGEGDART